MASFMRASGCMQYTDSTRRQSTKVPVVDAIRTIYRCFFADFNAAYKEEVWDLT